MALLFPHERRAFLTAELDFYVGTEIRDQLLKNAQDS